MVFKKRKFSRFRFRRRYVRRSGTKRLRRVIKNVIRRSTEIKYNTLGQTLSADATNYVLVELTPSILQGNTKTTRIGNRIRYKMLTVRFLVYLTSLLGAPTYTTRTTRVTIFQSRYLINILSFDPTLVWDDSLDWKSTMKGQSVRVMYDKMMTLVPQGVATNLGTNSGAFTARLNFKVSNNVTFTGNTEISPGDPKDRYYMIVQCSQRNATPLSFNINGSVFSRLSFIDF